MSSRSINQGKGAGKREGTIVMEEDPDQTLAASEGSVADPRFAALLCDTLPPQGAWSDRAYLWLTDCGNRLIEFTDGWLEELPMPTSTHQAVLLFLYDVFRAYFRERDGVVMVAPLRLRIRAGQFREPDLLLLRHRDDPRYADRYWLGADLVAEVLSPDNPDRDLVQKRAEYAAADIPEYWIADPRNETILVLSLDHGNYREVGLYSRGDVAPSPSLDGLLMDVAAVFDAAKPAR